MNEQNQGGYNDGRGQPNTAGMATQGLPNQTFQGANQGGQGGPSSQGQGPSSQGLNPNQVLGLLRSARQQVAELRSAQPKQSDIQGLQLIGAAIGARSPEQIALLEMLVRTTASAESETILAVCVQALETFQAATTNTFSTGVHTEAEHGMQLQGQPQPGPYDISLSYLSRTVTLHTAQEAGPQAANQDGAHIIVCAYPSSLAQAGMQYPHRIPIQYGQPLAGMQIASALLFEPPTTAQDAEWLNALGTRMAFGKGIRLYGPTPWINAQPPSLLVICWDRQEIDAAVLVYGPSAWVTLWGGEITSNQISSIILSGQPQTAPQLTWFNTMLHNAGLENVPRQIQNFGGGTQGYTTSRTATQNAGALAFGG